MLRTETRGQRKRVFYRPFTVYWHQYAYVWAITLLSLLSIGPDMATDCQETVDGMPYHGDTGASLHSNRRQLSHGIAFHLQFLGQGP